MGGESNVIFIFDVAQRQFYESNTRSPISSWCHAIAPSDRQHDELLVDGFVSSMLRSLEFDAVFPGSLIKLISEWYSDESVHVLGFGSGDHYRISVDDILAQMTLIS